MIVLFKYILTFTKKDNIYVSHILGRPYNELIMIL